MGQQPNCPAPSPAGGPMVIPPPMGAPPSPPAARAGAAPGIEAFPERTSPPPPGDVAITCIDYGPERGEERVVDDLDRFLASPRPAWAKVRWLNVDGLHPWVVDRLRLAYGFHSLNAEDVLRSRERPRVERHPDHVFVVASMLQRIDGRLVTRQVSFFLYESLLISFQPDRRDDVWTPVRQSIRRQESIVRNAEAGFLLYSLLDQMIDHLFPVVEELGDELEEAEESVLGRPEPSVARAIHSIRREMVQIRRVIWPMRLMLHDLQTGEERLISPTTSTYLRDVHEHALQLIDLVEIFREMASGMVELYLSANSYRMNDIIKVLTIISTIFIPITFLAGVWGMNFRHMPELASRWGYPAFWILSLLIAGGLLLYFRRKGWIGEE